MNHIFYKTRICKNFVEGTCRNGEHCTFAHGVGDLRQPLPNWQQLVREKERGVANSGDDHRPATHRMRICNKYYNGEECPYGVNCNFLHERPIRYQTTNVTRQLQRESVAISIGTSEQDSLQSKPPSVPIISPSPTNEDKDVERKKALKWKLNRQINRIYADWLDDLSPPRNPPTTKEEM